MTLLTTVFAAVVATAFWYKNQPEDDLKLGILCWLFWGASLMWLADAIFEYAELGAEYFAPAAEDMLNDLFLGLCVIALAMVIWVVNLLIKDPKGVIKKMLFRVKTAE